MTDESSWVRQTFVRPTAHRGLHDAAMAIVENSGPAFAAAMAAGYAAECDLRPDSDGEPFVFHDARLDRLIDRQGLLADLPTAEVRQLRYRASAQPILHFADLLALVAGRIPLLVEVKSDWGPVDPAFIARIADTARAQSGPLLFMSFDPAVLVALAAAAPGIPRGVISGRYGPPGWWADQLSPDRQVSLTRMEEAEAADPALVAWCVDHLPDPNVAQARAKGRPVLAWTVRTPAQQEVAARHADAPIFELPIRP